MKKKRNTPATGTEREFFTDNLLVQIHVIIVMIRWTGLAPWEFESPFPGSLTSTFLQREHIFSVKPDIFDCVRRAPRPKPQDLSPRH